jgi:hypothetical protein
MVKENEVGMKTVYTRNYSGLILYLNRMGTGIGETFFFGYYGNGSSYMHKCSLEQTVIYHQNFSY